MLFQTKHYKILLIRIKRHAILCMEQSFVASLPPSIPDIFNYLMVWKSNNVDIKIRGLLRQPRYASQSRCCW